MDVSSLWSVTSPTSSAPEANRATSVVEDFEKRMFLVARERFELSSAGPKPAMLVQLHHRASSQPLCLNILVKSLVITLTLMEN